MTAEPEGIIGQVFYNRAPGASGFRQYAAGILAHRQEFIDALVEAGVLRKPDGFYCHTTHSRFIRPSDHASRDCPGPHEKMYLVVQPHVHDWRIRHSGDPRPSRCSGVARAAVNSRRVKHRTFLREAPRL